MKGHDDPEQFGPDDLDGPPPEENPEWWEQYERETAAACAARDPDDWYDVYREEHPWEFPGLTEEPERE